MSQLNKTIQVGAPDPELKNSPISEEMDDDEVAVLEAEDQSVCYYNGTSYPAGQYVCSGSTELLQCNKGVWVQVGTCDPENQ
jgi:hypothetical protein